ncbi:MAG TPA: hypothetical protein VFW11_22880 [Cyclobacteriaceae bacterium]|nr:hypothetical protein [Cyclobacteriaceae bacterium]
MFRSYLTLVLVAFLMIAISCEEESDPRVNEETFTKIYDNNLFNAAYSPIDMKQTPDGGYLILASRSLEDSNFAGIYMMKVDKQGAFEKDMEVDAAYVNPVASLMEYNGEYYFFCMEEVTLQAQMAKADAMLENVSITPVQDNITYPTAASIESNSFILLSYNHIDKLSTISLIGPTGGTLASKGFDIGVGDDVEEPLINHFITGGKKLPFSVGRVPGGLYYFNGFFNYTFSLVFTDLNADDPTGVVQGQQDDGGFSAVTPIASTKFAAARFNFGDNFLLPNVILPTNSITSSVDYPGNTLLELVPNANIRIIRTVINSTNTLVYGSDSKSKQIALLFYDEATGALAGSHYLGFSNPFEVASLIQTTDEGLAVCGTTYLAGRFPRICLFKISKTDLAEMIQ